MKKIILLLFLLVGCTKTIQIPDVDSLWVNPVVSSADGRISEIDEKKVMRIFYGKFEPVSRNQVNITEETNAFNILLINYKINDEMTSITLWSSGYGTMSIGNKTMYVNFHDGVHEQLLEYIKNR